MKVRILKKGVRNQETEVRRSAFRRQESEVRRQKSGDRSQKTEFRIELRVTCVALRV